ncbi:MAG TPA: hypothetical protein VJA21_14470 [Verrucomicrobiae bacterium]
MKNRKLKFIRAVCLLAPRDELVRQLAERVPAAILPEYPGGAAIEFVAALSRFQSAYHCRFSFPRATKLRPRPPRPAFSRFTL